MVAGVKPSYVFLGCTTEMPGWELRPSTIEGAEAGKYGIVEADAAAQNATYFLISADIRGAPYQASRSYSFRQDKPAPLKLAAGNFERCLVSPCADDNSKMCGAAEGHGGRFWAVYGTAGRLMMLG